MKKEHIMQNAPSGRHRLIHASVASALALISISVQANTQQICPNSFLPAKQNRRQRPTQSQTQYYVFD